MGFTLFDRGYVIHIEIGFFGKPGARPSPAFPQAAYVLTDSLPDRLHLSFRNRLHELFFFWGYVLF